ncbi:NAD(P)H-dependent oxidoreductase subunit E, partial [Candidatus Aerophobetes bacterium]|nr:NAD(P)H-dependent oxidoreductase subunit E [Candidatus Aerophobetes bacterium]
MSQQVMEKVDRIIDRYGREKKALISILQDIQQEYNYLPKDVLLYIK